MVNKYASDLGVGATGRLMTKDEVVNICKEVDSNYVGNSSETFPTDAPSWLTSGNLWWLGSANDTDVWNVYGNNRCLISSTALYRRGLRPIIQVSKSYVEAAS